jgi:uncharacterized protein (UPF0276 family)
VPESGCVSRITALSPKLDPTLPGSKCILKIIWAVERRFATLKPSAGIIRFRCTASVSLGSTEELDATHLGRVRDVASRIEPGLISEHLSWSIVGGAYLADLLPLPLTEEALDVVCRNVEQVQTALGRQILVENPSSYLRFAHSTIPEWEFLSAVAGRTGCGILCDVNNVYVSACNHGWNPSVYLAALPANAVGEFNLAGHAVKEIGNRTLRIDDHGSRVSLEVWALYDQALARFGAVPTLIEWDTNIPAFDVLLGEASQAERAIQRSQEESTNADAA